MKSLVLIGDIVKSRESVDRSDLQERFKSVLADLNQRDVALVSPYTVTLGDEFQAVLENGFIAMEDVVRIQAHLFPAQIRFSFAVGEISTEINKEHALGMDGPGFYRARDGIEKMRKTGLLYRIDGLTEDIGGIANAGLAVASQAIRKWKKTRFQILLALQEGQNVQEIAKGVGISDKAVYKSIREGGLEEIRRLFEGVAAAVNKSMELQ